jgi:hypothetical protein
LIIFIFPGIIVLPFFNVSQVPYLRFIHMEHGPMKFQISNPSWNTSYA